MSELCLNFLIKTKLFNNLKLKQKLRKAETKLQEFMISIKNSKQINDNLS